MILEVTGNRKLKTVDHCPYIWHEDSGFQIN